MDESNSGNCYLVGKEMDYHPLTFVRRTASDLFGHTHNRQRQAVF